MTVAALYVETNGVYYGLPDVDPWDEERDARTYQGPWPVVAHPPCKSWSLMGQCRPEIVRGRDEGCFAQALSAVRTYGGVLEHPRHSRAWSVFNLPMPAAKGWSGTLWDRGWSCEVDQFAYGHRANKRTWLYFVGDADPPQLRWGARGKAQVTVRNDGGGGRDQRSRTPTAFRDVLLDMARSAMPKPCGDIAYAQGCLCRECYAYEDLSRPGLSVD